MYVILTPFHKPQVQVLTTQSPPGAVTPRIIGFMGESVPGIIKESPVKYVHDAQLRGRLFGFPESPSISSVFTDFFVDHTEALEALERVKAESGCLLGDLLPGHEFLLCAQVTRRRLPLTGSVHLRE